MQLNEIRFPMPDIPYGTSADFRIQVADNGMVSIMFTVQSHPANMQHIEETMRAAGYVKDNRFRDIIGPDESITVTFGWVYREGEYDD